MDPFVGLFCLIYLIPVIVWSLVAYWVYTDSRSYGMESVMWALIVFFGGLIGVFLYIYVREDKKKPQVAYYPAYYYPAPTYGYGQYPPYAPQNYSTTDVKCGLCGTMMKNPYHSKTLMCEKCGRTTHL